MDELQLPDFLTDARKLRPQFYIAIEAILVFAAMSCSLAGAQARSPQNESSIETGVEIAKKWTQPSANSSEAELPIDLRKDAKLYLFFNSKLGPSISKSGFLNQHQTGLSRGTFNPELRAKFEDLMAGRPLEPEYNPSPNSPVHLIRPKYLSVEIMTDRSTGVVVNDAEEFLMYGTAIAVLKDEVKNRTTFMFGDSLATHGPALLKGDKPQNLKLQSFYQKSLFIPKVKAAYSFIEGQVWGELRPSDIEYLMVYKKRATSDELSPLKSLNLPIYLYDIVDDDEAGYRVKKKSQVWTPLQKSYEQSHGHKECKSHFNVSL